MFEKKYQAFISSTYKDLIDERKEVIQAVLEKGCIPAGMELFPASNKKQWDLIKRVIDDCDFYLVISAGRYGDSGIDDQGNNVGYTEMELDYALKMSKPILALLHNNIDNIISEKVEKSFVTRKKLEKFRKKLQTGRTTKYWNNKDNLKSAVLTGIDEIKSDSNLNMRGWVRGGISLKDNSSVNSEKAVEITELLFEIRKDLTIYIQCVNNNDTEKANESIYKLHQNLSNAYTLSQMHKSFIDDELIKILTCVVNVWNEIVSCYSQMREKHKLIAKNNYVKKDFMILQAKFNAKKDELLEICNNGIQYIKDNYK